MRSSVASTHETTLRWGRFGAAVVVFLLAAAGLLSGPAWLGNTTSLFGLPAGNLVAWAAKVALALAAWEVVRRGSARKVAMAVVIASIAWLPVSTLLAGNVSLNFQGGGRLLAWLIYSGALLVLPVLLMSAAAWAAVYEWVRRVRS